MTARHVHSSGAQVRRFDHWRPAAIRILGGAAAALALAAVVAAGIESAPRVQAPAPDVLAADDPRRDFTPGGYEPATLPDTVPDDMQPWTPPEDATAEPARPQETPQRPDADKVLLEEETRTQPPDTGHAPSASTAPPGTTEQITDDTNDERAAYGCPSLTPDPALTGFAQQHAQTMADAQSMPHSGGPYAENIAQGWDAPDVVDAWMGSAGHRANILTCGNTLIGVGVVDAPGGPYTVQVFA